MIFVEQFKDFLKGLERWTTFPMAGTVASWFLYCNFLQLVAGEAFLSLKFLTFRNPGGLGSNGHCCDGKFIFCGSACDHSFTICLDNTAGPIWNYNQCAYGKFISRETSNANDITFRDKIGSIANPVVWRMNSWPGQARIKIDVVDIDELSNNDHVDYFQEVVYLQPFSYRNSVRFTMKKATQLTVEATVYCGQQYYGANCDQYCKPRNDYLGHYTCNLQSGAKICLTGWTGKDCNINEDNCIGITCQNGGTCRDFVNSYQCVCSSGFTGTFCERDINECLQGKVCNHGDCINTPGAFTCSCHTGYTGFNCRIDINDCLYSPCQNGAGCTDLVGDFQCSCRMGFTGKACEQDIDECQLDQCKNNGTCVNSQGGYRCECLMGYNGSDCALDIDECYSSPCKNGGVCTNVHGGYVCQCTIGFKGIHCDDDVDECDNSSVTCHNGGVCVNNIGNYTCSCLNGYSGHACETDVNECSSNPCEHNSTCHDLPGTYLCSCQEGYIGMNCEQNIDECLQAICKNGATCTDLDGSYKCTCSSFWQGRNCDENINECLSNPCKNGGTCQNVNEGFVCVCPTEFVGNFCEADMNECDLETSCENNSTCTNSFGNFTCNCLEGWRGRRCEADINECEISYCNNFGTCINLQGGFKCVCPINWQGTRCEEDVNECDSDVSPCRNNATCKNMIGTFHCDCSEGWIGPLCNEDLDECLQAPDICKTIGNSTVLENSQNDHIICLNTYPGYVCDCAEGWTGLECAEDINECVEDVTLCSSVINSTEDNATDVGNWTDSHRVCFNTHPGYDCICSEGWTGQNCEVDIRENYSATTGSFESSVNYTNYVVHDNNYKVHISDGISPNNTGYVGDTNITVAEVLTTLDTEEFLELTTADMHAPLGTEDIQDNEMTTISSGQMGTEYTDLNSKFSYSQTTATIIMNNKTINVDEQQFELDNLTKSRTGTEGNFSSSDQVQETNRAMITNETTADMEESFINGQSNDTNRLTDITVPFYLACQIPSDAEWTINKGLKQMFLDTQLFQGKELKVDHQSKIETSTTGLVVTAIHPVVTVDGKLLSDHEVTFVLNKVFHEMTKYLHCSLFLGAVRGNLGYSTSRLNSATSDWVLGLITACSVLVVAVVIAIAVKCYRRVTKWYLNKIQKESTSLSVVNPLYVPIGEGTENLEENDCHIFWTKTLEYKSHLILEDDVTDGQPGRVLM